MNIIRLTSVIASGVLLLSAFAPAAFASAAEISGNGAMSTSTATISNSSTNTSVQTNTSDTTNNVTNTVDTGHNTADNNTGGNVSLKTGSTLSRVDITNMSNLNKLDTSGSLSGAGDPSALISENGALSSNAASLSSDNTKSAFQTNTSDTINNVTDAHNTGFNDTSNNTGGNVDQTTGDSQSLTQIKNMSNANVLGSPSSDLASTATSSDPFSTRADIIGNGADSSNTATITQDNTALLEQTNTDLTTNNVSVTHTTGNNESDNNTGGSTSTTTGFTDSRIGIDNMANFNSAGLSSEDLATWVSNGGTAGAILGNGFESSNSVALSAEHTNSAFQTNSSTPLNNVLSSFDTGFNDTSNNTGPVFDMGTGSNTQTTGDSMGWTQVRNAGNMNSFGSALTLPSVNFSLDFGSLASSLGL